MDSDSKFKNHEPLSKTILQREFKFKLLQLDKKYNGTSDVFNHIINFHAGMHLQGVIDKNLS